MLIQQEQICNLAELLEFFLNAQRDSVTRFLTLIFGIKHSTWAPNEQFCKIVCFCDDCKVQNFLVAIANDFPNTKFYPEVTPVLKF